MSESDISLFKDTSWKIYISTYPVPDLSADIYPVQVITCFFCETYNIDPHTTHLQTETGSTTPLVMTLKLTPSRLPPRKIFCLRWSGSWYFIRYRLWTGNSSSLPWTISSQHFLPWFWKIRWRTKNEQSTVVTYGGRSKLYISQISI